MKRHTKAAQVILDLVEIRLVLPFRELPVLFPWLRKSFKRVVHMIGRSRAYSAISRADPPNAVPTSAISPATPRVA